MRINDLVTEDRVDEFAPAVVTPAGGQGMQPAPGAQPTQKIGRASCRERV